MVELKEAAHSDDALPAVAVGRRRLRRPSGDPPPLPHEAGWHARIWVAVSVVIAGLILAIPMEDQSPLPVDVNILRWAEGIRTTGSDNVAKAINIIATTTGILILRWGTILVLAIFKRFRHLAVALVTWGIVDLIFLSIRVELFRPSDLSPPITVITGPSTYWFPGAAMVAFSVTVFTMVVALVPLDRRGAALGAATLVLAVVAAARILLAASYPSALLYGAILGATIVELVFAWLTPPETFPVSYRPGGSAAHLDLGGQRGAAVRKAMHDQLGIEITEVAAFGDEGSGGSTPLLMTSADGTRIFGKILAISHVRSDRWYRMVRTIMYGKLEDEAPFGSVRRLISYEDYALRLLDDDRIRVAKSYGVVELTPNREYLLPTEFFEGSQTLGHAEVNDVIIDEAMTLVRALWDHGLAHRDIKPANLLVVDGRLQLIDVSGLENRPSPWRQAVDLANMMLVMALRSDADTVYRHALRSFGEDEIGEAFACAVGMAIPTELQHHLKADPRDLITEFKRLAPPHRPVSIQRWSVQRIGLTAAALVGVIVVVVGSVVVIRYGLN
jgi:membrane-associated phospholipid phosphatase